MSACFHVKEFDALVLPKLSFSAKRIFSGPVLSERTGLPGWV